MVNRKPIIKFNITRHMKNIRARVKANMYKVAITLEAHVKRSMSISNLGGKNPSQPGQVPHVGTAALKSSITSGVTENGNTITGYYGVAEGTASGYARILELGAVWSTSTGKIAEIKPRPFLKPAYQLNRKKIKRILTR